MANKYKAGDWVEVLDTKNVRGWNKDAIGYRFEITAKEIYTKEYSHTIYLDTENKYSTNYRASDLKLIKKPSKMATKKNKTGGITPKEGMYFTANMGKKKIRGYISSIYVSYNNNTEVLLDGKDFSNFDDEQDFPTYEELIYNATEETFEEALKEKQITNFVVCTDKRQKAIIDGDKSPKFGEWNVVNERGTLVFGCGSVKIAIKEAKTFIEIFCDYGCPDDVHCYYETEIGEDTQLEEYYQVRKWLEDNWTAAQIAVFNDVLKQIDDSREQNINDLECSEMKALLAKF